MHGLPAAAQHLQLRVRCPPHPAAETRPYREGGQSINLRRELRHPRVAAQGPKRGRISAEALKSGNAES